MADAPDSKSGGRKAVWVRVPPPVLGSNLRNRCCQGKHAIFKGFFLIIPLVDSSCLALAPHVVQCLGYFSRRDQLPDRSPFDYSCITIA
jgi:hypothetical protein